MPISPLLERPPVSRALSDTATGTDAYVQRPPAWAPGYTHTIEYHLGRRTHVYRRNPVDSVPLPSPATSNPARPSFLRSLSSDQPEPRMSDVMREMEATAARVESDKDMLARAKARREYLDAEHGVKRGTKPKDHTGFAKWLKTRMGHAGGRQSAYNAGTAPSGLTAAQIAERAAQATAAATQSGTKVGDE